MRVRVDPYVTVHILRCACATGLRRIGATAYSPLSARDWLTARHILPSLYVTGRQAAHTRRNVFDFKHVQPFDRNNIDKPGPCVLFASPGMVSRPIHR
eukprot:2539873-Pyramimonas_sp.AAC.1